MELEPICLPVQDPQTQSGQSLRYRRTFVLFAWPEAPGRSLRPSPHHSPFFSSLAIPDFLYLLYPSFFFLISPPPKDNHIIHNVFLRSLRVPQGRECFIRSPTYVQITSLTHPAKQQMHNSLKESDPEVAQIMVCSHPIVLTIWSML
jgi:hypothetical protein